MKEKIIQYLKDNGMSHVSELQRAIGCGRSTIYKAIAELEDEEKITSIKRRDKRYIKLRMFVPTYIKMLIVATVFIAIFTYYDFMIKDVGVVINFSTHKNVAFIQDVKVSPILVSFLLGFWIATVMFRSEDLETVYFILKAKCRRFISEKLRKLKI